MVGRVDVAGRKSKRCWSVEYAKNSPESIAKKYGSTRVVAGTCGGCNHAPAMAVRSV